MKNINLKNSLYILAVLLLTFLIDRGLGIYLNNITKKSMFRYSRMYSSNAKADIVLLGNSRGLTFYEPWIEKNTGLKVVNLSYNGMPADLGVSLLRDYVELNGTPKMVLVEGTMCDRENTPLTVSFTPYMILSKHLDTLIHSANDRMWWGTRISHLFRYNGEVFQRTLFHMKKPDNDWLLDRVISPTLINTLTKEEQRPYPIYERQLSSMGKISELAREKGFQLNIVIAPYYPGFRSKILDMEGFTRKIEGHTKTKVHDYSSLLTEDKYFGDFQHVNKAGAAIFLEKLQADSILPKR
jgi:hypothetical protein